MTSSGIFISYRRDDARDMAARIHDRLADAFGSTKVFLDVDKLSAGQRFDVELAKALTNTDVLLAIIGPRWQDLLHERPGAMEPDYVVEEIAGALEKGKTVIPVLVDRTPLPRAELLPQQIRTMLLHQALSVTHERFGSDIAALVNAIRKARGHSTRWNGVRTALGILAGAALAGIGGPLIVKLIASRSDLPDGRVNSKVIASDKSDKTMGGTSTAAPIGAKEPADTPARPITGGLAATDLVAVPSGPTPGSIFRDCADVCPDMVVIPAGRYDMGSTERSNEGPAHKVVFARPFSLSRHEITFAQWDACVADGGCSTNRRPNDEGWGRGFRPVVNVSWQDAEQYTLWLSRKTGQTYRLPSEAEWEYAARAGADASTGGGDRLTTRQANYGSNSTREVGSSDPNSFGLFDMWGNVWEWCSDTYFPNHDGAPGDGMSRTGSADGRVLRGGSWSVGKQDLRATVRINAPAGFRFKDIGFRVAKSL